MAGVRHYHQTSAVVKTKREHRGVAPAAQFRSNHLVEIPPQCDPFEVEQVPLHQFAEPLAKHCHGLSVAADIGKSDARDDTTGADRDKVNIAASVRLAARKAPRHRRHGIPAIFRACGVNVRRCSFLSPGGSAGNQDYSMALLILFTDRLGIGFAVGVEEFLAALLPSGFQFGRGDVPVRAAFPGNGA